MTIKVLLALVMVLSFITMPVLAQDQPPSSEDIVSKMQSKLNLTQDQLGAITPIVEKYSSKREEIRQSMQDGTADKDGIRGQMKQLKEDEKQELSQVLSAEQLSQWDQMQGQGRRKHSDNGDEGDNNSNGSGAGG